MPINWVKLKEERELGMCQRVVKEINRIEGTDFVVKKGETEAHDALLKSASRKYPDRPAEVVSIPHALVAREENDNFLKIEQRLLTCLREMGFDHSVVSVSLTDDGSEKGIRPALIRVLANLIFEERGANSVVLKSGDIYARSPELAELVSVIFVNYSSDWRGIEVGVSNGGGWIPSDGRWIEEGIELKLKKYGGASAAADLTLVIDASVFVNREQVFSFQKAHPPNELPFAEIWIVTAFAGALALKSRLDA